MASKHAELLETVTVAFKPWCAETAARSNAVTSSPTQAARLALDAIPDGWAKVDGEWLQAHRTYLNGDTNRPTNEWVVIGPEVT